QSWYKGPHLVLPQASLQGLLIWWWIKTCRVRAIGLRMGPHGATVHIVSLPRQARSSLPDGIEEQHGLAIGMDAASQETGHVRSQDVPAIDCIQELIAIGTATPDRHIGGMTGSALSQLLSRQPLRMGRQLIEKAGLYPSRDNIHCLEPIAPSSQPFGLLLQA